MGRVQDYEAVEGEAVSGIRSAKEPRHWVGVEPIAIPAGSEVTLNFAPNMDMNPDSLIIPNLLAPLVAVTGAAIGPISIAAGDGPFPGEAFTADSTLRFLPAVPITQGQPLRIRVRNMTTNAIPAFYCGIVGKVKRAT